MSWNPDYNLNMIDVSRHQGTPDWKEVKEKNPNIKAIFNRVSVGDYYLDNAFQTNYDNQIDAGFNVGVYFVVHPNTNFSGMQRKFREGLDGREPDAIVVDCEKAKHWTMPRISTVRSYTYDTFQWVTDEFPNATILNYTAKWYWVVWIGNVSWVNDYPIILASYPDVTAFTGYKQAKSFKDIESNLRYLQAFPLKPSYMTNVRGWQFSEKGQIAGIDTTSTDLDLLDPVLYNKIWEKESNQPEFNIDMAIDNINEILSEIQRNYKEKSE